MTSDTAALSDTTNKPLQVVFLHLDLGIGGAEQLVLQLAHASASPHVGHEVHLVTTRCDPTHCFASVQPGGDLHDALHVKGRWIPADLCGYARAFCSTLRVLYLSFWTARRWPDVDLIVVDVLPTPLPFLRYLSHAALLFYCHFPDQLLVRQPSASGRVSQNHRALALAKHYYRQLLNAVEELSMRHADLCVVNSCFTQQTVRNTFPSSFPEPNPLPVLYPALDVASLDRQQQQQEKLEGAPSVVDLISSSSNKKKNLIVSLNRYERKKNLDLLIRAAAWLRQHNQPKPEAVANQTEQTHFEIVIAGGYDVRNVENVEYRAELEQLANQLNVPVTFLQSIDDGTRASLLAHALCVVYTPTGEHFGIVPLEAMYVGTPVVAVDDGGPKETIRHGVTGFLCQPTPADFGQALQTLLNDPEHAERMGRAGREHVRDTFGEERLWREWNSLTQQAVQKARNRRSEHSGSQYRILHVLLYLGEALFIAIVCLILTFVLQYAGVLGQSGSIFGSVKDMMRGRDEF